MEETFKQQLLALKERDNRSILLSKEEYFNLVEEVKSAACIDKTKTWRQYYVLKRYEILQCGDVEKLVLKKKDAEGVVSTDNIYFVHMEELFDIVKRVHTSTGHGGRDKMMKVISAKYANVTREVVDLFKSLCVECQKKRKRDKCKGVVVKPILSSDYGSRGQVDLIDMQSMPSGRYRWIMVYQVCTIAHVYLKHYDN